MKDKINSLIEAKNEADKKYVENWNREKRFASLYNQYSKNSGEKKNKEDHHPGNATNVVYKT